MQVKHFSCCHNCPRRSPACSDRCADYLMAKAMRQAEAEWTREQVRRRQRGVNGRK